MDAELSIKLIERDWAALAAQCARLYLGEPKLVDLQVFITVVIEEADGPFLAALECDDYNVQAPLLDFADPDDPVHRGKPYWPKYANAPMNSIMIGERNVPIMCTPGTRGYHLHTSHAAERFDPSTWPLALSATLLWRLTHEMGDYQGRGL